MIKNENKRIPVTLKPKVLKKLEKMTSETSMSKSEIISSLILGSTIETEIRKVKIKGK